MSKNTSMTAAIAADRTPAEQAVGFSAGGGKPVWVAAYLMVCCAVTAAAVLAIRSRPCARSGG